MDPITASAIIGGVGAAGSGLLSLGNSRRAQATARRNTDATIAHQMEMAQYAYSQDREMWNLANEYNSPQNQMARLKSAGLNPHLVYGNGSVVGNTSTQTPQYQSVKPEYNYKPVEMPTGMLSQFTNTALQMAQVDNVRANEKKVNMETLKTLEETGLTKMNKKAREIQNEILDEQSAALKMKPAFELGTENLKQEGMKIDNARKGIARELENMRTQWEKAGVTPRDKMMWRVIGRVLPSIGLPEKAVIGILGKDLFKLLNE